MNSKEKLYLVKQANPFFRKLFRITPTPPPPRPPATGVITNVSKGVKQPAKIGVNEKAQQNLSFGDNNATIPSEPVVNPDSNSTTAPIESNSTKNKKLQLGIPEF